MIPFGEYLPDLPVLNNPGATEAQNVIPFGGNYKQFSGLNVFSGALTARCQGAFSGTDTAGNVHTFAGDASKLYKYQSAGTFADVSKVGGYTTASDGIWQMIQWNDKVIATNFGDAIQTFTLSSGSAFADLSVDAPQARYITAIRDFVVVGNTYDSIDGNMPNRIRWCGIGDETSWTVSATTLADYNDLVTGGGWVQGIVGGEYGLVFQEKSIWRMTFVGSPDVFQFDEIEKGRGTPAPSSIINLGRLAFYLSDDGFYMFDGANSYPIGANKIDKTFYADVDQTYLYRIYGAIDPINKLVMWAYPGSSNSGGDPNKILIYNWTDKRWAYAVVDSEILLRTLTTGYTLDTLDNLSASLDALPFSLDSRAYTGGKLQLGAFSTAHKLGYFNGSALAAVLETGEVQLFPARRANVKKIRPYVNGSGTVTVQVGSRNLQSDSVTWGSAASVNSTGDCDVRDNAMYHRFRVNASGGFNSVQGVEIMEANPAGKR